MRKDDVIKLTKEQKSKAVTQIKEYIEKEFDIDIGNLQSDIFLDFITENIGSYYYNKALSDSMVYMNEKIEELYLLMKEENL